MKSSKHIFVVSLVIILAFTAGVNLSEASQIGNHISPTSTTSHESNAPWQSQFVHQVDYPLDVGKYASLAFRPFDNIPYISYYDAANGDLMLAHYLPQSGGNCGTHNHWFCEVLDGADGTDVGQYSSLDFWADEANHGWKIGISYHAVTGNSLKYTTWWCSEQYCTRRITHMINASWVTKTSVGLFTSLKFGPEGTPHIAYYYADDNFFGINYLKYASYVGSGGNCGVTDWQCDKVDSSEHEVGLYASLDLTYDGTPYLAYYDLGGGDLKLAYFLGITEEDCYADNGWVCPIIDGTDGSDVGLYASLTAQHSPEDQLLRIVYYDKTHGQLKYYDPDWGPIVVDDMGASLSPMGISMDIDKDGYPIIVYQQSKPGDYETPDLRIARPYLAFQGLSFGNCGAIPPDWDSLYWRCNTLDYGGQYYDEAEYASVKVNSSGLAGVAYSEFYDYDAGDHATSLKYMIQKLPTFLPILYKH